MGAHHPTSKNRGLRLEAGSLAQRFWVMKVKPRAEARSMQIDLLALQHLQTLVASTAMPPDCLTIAHLLAHQEQLTLAQRDLPLTFASVAGAVLELV